MASRARAARPVSTESLGIWAVMRSVGEPRRVPVCGACGAFLQDFTESLWRCPWSRAWGDCDRPFNRDMSKWPIGIVAGAGPAVGR